MLSAVPGTAQGREHKPRSPMSRRHATAVVSALLLIAAVPDDAVAQTARVQPLGNYVDVMRRLAATTADQGQIYETRGDLANALSTYATSANSAAQTVNSRSLTLQDRLSLELTVSIASLDATRVIVRMSGGRDARALQYLAAAEQWQEAAMRDAGAIDATQARGASLVALAYTAQGYLDAMEGNQNAALAHLARAPQIQPAQNLLTAYDTQYTPRRGINARSLYAMWQNRPRPLSPEEVKFLQVTTALVTKALKGPYTSVIGSFVSTGIGLFQRPSP